MAENGGNGGNGRRWEAYTLKILSALLAVISILFWDMRQDIIALRRVSDQRTAAVIKLSEIDAVIRDHERLLAARGTQLAVIERRLLSLEDRQDKQARIMQDLGVRGE